VFVSIENHSHSSRTLYCLASLEAEIGLRRLLSMKHAGIQELAPMNGLHPANRSPGLPKVLMAGQLLIDWGKGPDPDSI
jgi:hypothetical protein